MNELEDHDQAAIAEPSPALNGSGPAMEPSGEVEAPSHTERARNTIAEWTVTILLLLFGTTTLVQAFVIPTPSMEPTLLVGDYLLVDKLAYAPPGAVSKYLLPYQEPKHGDIIVFRYPLDITQNYVKRVIGLPGDHIKMVGRTVYRNGRPLNEPYAYYRSQVSDLYRENFPGVPNINATDGVRDILRDMFRNNVVNGELVIPPNCYFAMGDNRDNSADSRFWGFVPRANIIGKPLLVYWSFATDSPSLTGSSPGNFVQHVGDIALHFFSKTRWRRMFMLIHGDNSNN